MYSGGLLLIFLLLAAAAFTGGCVSGNPKTAPEPNAPSILETATPAPDLTVTNTPVVANRTLPDIYQVAVQLDRNVIATDPYILATFRGGKGMDAVTRVDMTVTRSDGIIETGTMQDPQIGDTIQLNGTRGRDHVLVTVSLGTGNTYTLYNKDMQFRAHF